MITHGQHIGEHLRRVPLTGEAVPDWHAGESAEDLDRLLGEPAELDTVEHPAEHPRGVLHRLLAAKLGIVRPEVGDVAALIVRGDLEGGPGPRGRLLEDQGDATALEPAGPLTQPLLHLEVTAEVDKVAEFIRRQVGLLKQIASYQVHRCSRLVERLAVST